MFAHHMLKNKLSNYRRGGIGSGRQEVGHFTEPVNDHQNPSVPLGSGRQVHYKVHSNILPWPFGDR